MSNRRHASVAGATSEYYLLQCFLHTVQPSRRFPDAEQLPVCPKSTLPYFLIRPAQELRAKREQAMYDLREFEKACPHWQKRLSSKLQRAHAPPCPRRPHSRTLWPAHGLLLPSRRSALSSRRSSLTATRTKGWKSYASWTTRRASCRQQMSWTGSTMGECRG